MHKRQDEKNVKTYYEFDNDPVKMCLEHKTRMKVDHSIKIKKLINFFLSCKL
jgi:hypothetical protein